MWDADDGAELWRAGRHRGSVLGCAFSPDGRQIVSADSDGLRVWETESGAEVLTLTGHTDTVTACAYSPVDD